LSIGKEPSFGVNSFNQAKYKNETETIANAILNLLFGKPGYFPSMPNLGINIQSYLYGFWDELNVTHIKALIATQCQIFREYVDDGSLDVIKTELNGSPILLIVIPVQIKNTVDSLAIGLKQDKNGELSYNYVLEQTEY
jgi:hypothetical protein